MKPRHSIAWPAFRRGNEKGETERLYVLVGIEVEKGRPSPLLGPAEEKILSLVAETPKVVSYISRGRKKEGHIGACHDTRPNKGRERIHSSSLWSERSCRICFASEIIQGEEEGKRREGGIVPHLGLER